MYNKMPRKKKKKAVTFSGITAERGTLVLPVEAPLITQPYRRRNVFSFYLP